jgi:hypothetical protein
MKVLAIDPGSKLGWCTDATGRLEWGTEDFRIRNGESSGNRWRRFGEWLNSVTIRNPLGFATEVVRKEGRVFVSGMEFIAQADCKPGDLVAVLSGSGKVEPYTRRAVDLIIYERAVFMPKARAAAEIAAGFTTRLEEHCERHGIALEPVAVQTLKAYALPKVKRKKGEPKMDRSKAAMIEAARKRLELEYVHRPGQFVRDGMIDSPRWLADGFTEHEADALWLYWMAKERDR